MLALNSIDDDKIKKAISLGIKKLNINTEFQLAWTLAVRDFLNSSEEYDPRKIIKSGELALKKVAYDKIELMGSNNKA